MAQISESGNMTRNIKIKLVDATDIPILLEYINYDMNTGEFTWEQDVSSRALEGESCGSMSNDGKLYIELLGHRYLAAKLAYFSLFGVLPSNIGYVDRDPSNLRFDNLEIISRGVAIRRGKVERALI